MRASSLVLAIAAVAALSACGKSNTVPAASDQAVAPSEPASAPAEATGPTEAQKALLASLPAPYNTGDIENGKSKFLQCRSCHTITEGGPNMTGPNLFGVFGRKAGTVASFSYSDGLKTAGWTWDAAQIDKWIENPRALVADTKMSFAGLKDAKDRTDVIAYLKVSTSK